MNISILDALRRLHGWMYQQRRSAREVKALKDTRAPGKNVWLLGTPTHPNVGDSAIVIAEMNFLKRCGIDEKNIHEITYPKYDRIHWCFRRCLQKDDLLFWHGGGNMGSQWPHEEALRRKALKRLHHKILIFPQTIFYGSTPQETREKERSIPVYNGRKNLTIIAREQPSYDIMAQLYPDTRLLLIPDIVLSASMHTFGVSDQKKREGVLLCFRSDVERVMTEEQVRELEQAVLGVGEDVGYTDMYMEGFVTEKMRGEFVRGKMQQFASAKLVITDRLHCMVFCAITGTPCIAFCSNNHKVNATYEWIKYLPYVRYAETVKHAQAILPEMLAMEKCRYDNGPLLPHYEKLE